MRRAAPAAALIEEHRPVARGIELPAHARAAPLPGPAGHDDRRLALRVAADVPVDAVAVADVQEAAVVALDRLIALGHRGNLLRALGTQAAAASSDRASTARRPPLVQSPLHADG